MIDACFLKLQYSSENIFRYHDLLLYEKFINNKQQNLQSMTKEEIQEFKKELELKLKTLE
jgi:hypothetical protein